MASAASGRGGIELGSFGHCRWHCRRHGIGGCKADGKISFGPSGRLLARGCAQQGRYRRGIRTRGGFISFGCSRHAHGRWYQVQQAWIWQFWSSPTCGMPRVQKTSQWLSTWTHLFHFPLQEGFSLGTARGPEEEQSNADPSPTGIPRGARPARRSKPSANTGGMPSGGGGQPKPKRVTTAWQLQWTSF